MHNDPPPTTSPHHDHPGAPDPTAASAPGVAAPGKVGRYRIVRHIADGGMGSVYEAVHEVTRSRAALKLVKPGFDTREVIARFNAERQILARFDHPNIAKVLDAGVDEATGRPYFAMEFISGAAPITDFADANRLTVRQRLELFRQACAAIQHAHTKAILHRDIKPTNVLAHFVDSKPEVKVIDFGVAKALTGERLPGMTYVTDSGVLIGTYEYMSPEQADGSADIDTRSDVYSLGVLLYELLAGVKPFDRAELAKAADAELRRIIRDVEPPKPSTRLTALAPETGTQVAQRRHTERETLARELRRELEWVPLMAMRKERGRRYATVEAMSADVENYLIGRPLVAAPESKTYRLRKWMRRYAAVLAVVATIALLLVAGIAGTGVGFVRARQAAQLAQDREAEAIASRSEAVQQRNAAEESRRLAEEARQVAETQSKLARKSAALADARYRMSQQDLPAAWARLEEADAIGLETADRMVLNDFFNASRQRCVLQAMVERPVGELRSGTFVETESGRSLLLVNDGRLLQVIDPSSGQTTGESLPLKVFPRSWHRPVKQGTVLMQVGANELTTFGLEPLRQLKTRDIGSDILAMDAASGVIVTYCGDGSLRLLDAESLEDIAVWRAEQLPRGLGAGRASCVISPDAKYVVLHLGSWAFPTIVLDRQKYLAGEANPFIVATDVRFGSVCFDAKFKGVFYSWFSSSGTNGGLADEFNTYQIIDDKVIYTRSNRVPTADLKGSVGLQSSTRGFATLVSKIGVVMEGLYGESETRRVHRFSSIWPFGSTLDLLAYDAEQNVLALKSDRHLLFFKFQNELDFNVQDWASTSTSKGVWGLEGAGARVTLSFEPFELTETRRFRLQIPWPEEMKESVWWPRGLWVSPDERTVAAYALETDGSNTSAAVSKRRVVLVYDLAGPIDQPASWRPPRPLSLSAFGARHPPGPSVVRVSQDGQSALVSMLQAGDLYLGGAVGGWYQSETMRCVGVSPDGSLVAVRQADGSSLDVRRTWTGDVIQSLNDPSSVREVRFSTAGDAVIVARSGERVEAIDLKSGGQLWQHKSPIIPEAWPTSGSHFLGLVRDAADGGVLYLVNKQNFSDTVVVSRTYQPGALATFSPDGSAIAVQRHRWRSDIHRLFTLPNLEQALRTPVRLDDKTASATTRPAAVRPTTVPATRPAPVAQASLMPSTRPSVTAAGPSVLDATDLAAIRSRLNSSVTIEGTIDSASWTRSHDAGNIFLVAKGDEEGLLVWIPSGLLTQLQERAPFDFDGTDLPGATIRVTGRLSMYGGYSKRLQGRIQITPGSPKDITITSKP